MHDLSVRSAVLVAVVIVAAIAVVKHLGWISGAYARWISGLNP
jgi:hypothetical protein